MESRSETAIAHAGPDAGPARPSGCLDDRIALDESDTDGMIPIVLLLGNCSSINRAWRWYEGFDAIRPIWMIDETNERPGCLGECPEMTLEPLSPGR